MSEVQMVMVQCQASMVGGEFASVTIISVISSDDLGRGSMPAPLIALSADRFKCTQGN